MSKPTRLPQADEQVVLEELQVELVNLEELPRFQSLLITAIESGTADFIQQYDPDLWPKPADDAPFIESIEVVIPGDGGESEKSSDAKPH